MNTDKRTDVNLSVFSICVYLCSSVVPFFLWVKVLSVLFTERAGVSARIAKDRLRQIRRRADDGFAADDALPRAALRQHQHRAAAARAYPLIMLRRVVHPVIEAELRFDLDQIFDVHA